MEIPVVTTEIHEVEWYPVYELNLANDTFSDEYHLTQAFVQRYNKAYTEFKAVQKVLRELYEEKN